MLNYKKEVNNIIKRTKKEVFISNGIINTIKTWMDCKKYFAKTTTKEELKSIFLYELCDNITVSKHHMDGLTLYNVFKICKEELKGDKNQYRRAFARLNNLKLYAYNWGKFACINFIKGY